jgi:RHH-type proline utilization regulon transcriptional repressor/proline dehydrogenase/delta 1-pyrroline-5-carboxylate dehydrogenase
VEFTEKPIFEAEYTTPLSNFVSDELDKARINFAFSNYRKIWDDEFSQEKDVCHIYGEENIFRYLPVKNMGFRVQENDNLADILLVIIAANTAGTTLSVSISENNPNIEIIRKVADSVHGIAGQTRNDSFFADTKIIIQDEATFIENMEQYERIRTVSPESSDAFYQKAAKLGQYIADSKPLIEGRVELLHYLKEQSIAYEYHRYGSVFRTFFSK